MPGGHIFDKNLKNDDPSFIHNDVNLETQVSAIKKNRLFPDLIFVNGVPKGQTIKYW